MLITTKGVVLKEITVGSDDKLITILTKECGKITAYVKNSKRLKTKFASSTDLLCYSTFVLFKSKDKYYINSAESENVFFDIRTDIEKLSLASFFVEVASEVTTENENGEEFLRLILNSFYFIEKGIYPLSHIKTVFELRALCITGYMPDLVACNGCGVYEDDIMYFSYQTGKIHCKNCKGEISSYAKLNKSVLYAMRFICYSPFEKIFSFSLSDENLKLLGVTTENYLIYIL
ncbi:MAG: DNA repair protein RecO, partial [Oscillospiraceae bacterium]